MLSFGIFSLLFMCTSIWLLLLCLYLFKYVMGTLLFLVFEHVVHTFFAVNINRAYKTISNSTTTLRLSQSMLLYDNHHTRVLVTF